MIWSKLHLVIILYMVIWVFISSMTMKMIKIRDLKQSQIITLEIKDKLQNWKFEYSEKNVLDEVKKIYSFKSYQVINKSDLYEEFINTNKNLIYPRWIVFQGWSIWENKEIQLNLNENEYKNIYLVYSYQKFTNVIKLK